MDWVKQLNEAINYIEENLTGDEDIDISIFDTTTIHSNSAAEFALN